jgi:hypothetical protein
MNCTFNENSACNNLVVIIFLFYIIYLWWSSINCEWIRGIVMFMSGCTYFICLFIFVKVPLFVFRLFLSHLSDLNGINSIFILVGSYLFLSIDSSSSYSSSDPEMNGNTSQCYKSPTTSPSSLTIASINNPMSEYTVICMGRLA